jgi:hypothetical protein
MIVCLFPAELVSVELDTTTLTTYTYILPRRKNKNKEKSIYIHLLLFLFLLSHFSKHFVLCETFFADMNHAYELFVGDSLVWRLL